MKTVSSIAAAGSVTALSAVGLVLARREEQQHPQHHHDLPSKRASTIPSADMTAVAGYPLSTPFDTYALLPPPTSRLAADVNNGNTQSGDQKANHKRRISLTSRASHSAGMDKVERSLGAEDEQRGGRLLSSALRRLSSTRSRTPTSRPSSVAYTNGSTAVSHSGSTTPMFPSNTSSPLPPNKLVKRSASLHSAKGSPSQGSRLPIPTFRRPATSHQRSATLQDRLSYSDRSDRVSLDGAGQEARDTSWRHYFTPRVSFAELSNPRRRSSTSIPNPIKRVYPDRKYTPTLVSARQVVKPASVELDESWSDDEDHVLTTTFQMAPSSASSPFPPHATHFEEATAPRRSFSIGDLLSTGPHSTWRRPSTSRSKLSKSVRKGRPRVTSAPQVPMGHTFSTSGGLDSERLAKRRDITDPKDSHRSIYSSSSSNNALRTDSRPEIDLNLGGDSPSLHFTPDRALFVDTTPHHAPTTADAEQTRVLSATLSSSSAGNKRHSARSEITSTVGSDSERLSFGDHSTDYQSDAPHDSLQTRTTRSSSGRRGPHIETIFDDSPPTFSSGKSTRLRDFLSDGQSSAEYNGHFRHSTIEEEESVVSTPVRSLHNKSITSTPSARVGVPQIFSSSPPTMNILPDPDEIDWDAMENDKSERGLGIERLSGTPTTATDGAKISRGVSFRFGPTLRPSMAHSANSTPQRNGASPGDRANLFDWAEQQPSPSHANDSPPRPRTVHGKKDQDSRGSRPAGRRPVSGMHARSHSVPVVPDVDAKRNSVTANKFGTWGVGTKAVTEDWNEDFDFDETRFSNPGVTAMDEKRIDSGHEMFVPISIREQQENVVANIGLLREWGLLIEELKELRMRAVALDIMHGPYAQSWKEVDAMIELADQETEEQTLEPRRSPPSSPGFDYSAFEDTPVRTSHHNHKLVDTSEAVTRQNELPSTPRTTPLKTRPRKDSELVAQNVIAALQSRKSIVDASEVPGSPSRKVPFDTATLRHIVPYVHGLKRKVKDALRETEGLYSSPHRRTSPDMMARRDRLGDGPDLRNIFDEPHDRHSPFEHPSRRERAATDNDGGLDDIS